MYCKEHIRAIAASVIFLVLTACSGSSTDTFPAQSQALTEEVPENPVTDPIETPVDSISPTTPATK